MSSCTFNPPPPLSTFKEPGSSIGLSIGLADGPHMGPICCTFMALIPLLYLNVECSDHVNDGRVAWWSGRGVHCRKSTVIIFPRYNLKCSGGNVILRGIFHVVTRFPLHSCSIAEIWINFRTLWPGGVGGTTRAPRECTL